MKPAPFAYARAGSLEQVFDLLARYGDEARLVAGGQSLIPTLHCASRRPAVLIDLDGPAALAGIAIDNAALRIGAPTRRRTIAKCDEVVRDAPLLGTAVPPVAHPAIRNRRTASTAPCSGR